jgi:hypothetical protein
VQRLRLLERLEADLWENLWMVRVAILLEREHELDAGRGADTT